MATAPELPLIIRYLGCRPYLETFEAMKTFTANRDETTSDEIWLLEHQPVFTQGQAGKQEYILDPGDIPVVQSDRGGHITYHGPGQITGYLLVDMRRLGMGVRDLVDLIEQALVETTGHWGIDAAPRSDAPGVYIQPSDELGGKKSGGKKPGEAKPGGEKTGSEKAGAKIGSLGLRVRRGCSYHGFNFNVAMDLSPWQRINPCGLGVEMTQLNDLLDSPVVLTDVAEYLAEILTAKLGYNGRTLEYKEC